MYYDCGFPGHLHYFIVSCMYYVCGSPGHHHYFIFISTICSVVCFPKQISSLDLCRLAEMTKYLSFYQD